MPETIQLGLPSESTNGEPIQIAATTSGTADVIHTCSGAGVSMVEIHAISRHPSVVTLTLLLGSVATGDQWPVDIVPGYFMLVLPEAVFTGGLVISAFASVGDVVSIIAKVRTIS